MAQKITSVFIVGPTASGKSDLAMKVAQEFCGEIICADSQTVRKGIDIGTAKPTKNDQQAIKHHLLDVIDPYENFSVAQFKELALQALEDIKKRQKLPIIVGGTGLYIDALLYDFKFRKTESELTRADLEALSVDEMQGIIDKENLPMPENDQNPRHLIRTIETRGQQSKKGDKLKGSVIIGIDPGKVVLEERIKGRIQKMIADGFLEEVETVLAKYGEPPSRFDAIGYKIAFNNRDKEGNYDLESIAEQFAVADRKYAKRQRSWLKRSKDIIWFKDSVSAFSYLNKLF